MRTHLAAVAAVAALGGALTGYLAAPRPAAPTRAGPRPRSPPAPGTWR
ncbi:hypothetical protein ACFQHO_50985 [Actinomadura yumaensis]